MKTINQERKERICAYISSKEYIPLTFDELCVTLDVPSDAREEFNEILDELCNEHKIYTTKKARYMPYESERDTVTGRLSCNAKGFFGFVISDDNDDVFVKGEDMNGALNGDTVVVKLYEKSQAGHREGKIIRISERHNKVVSGVFYHIDNEDYYYLKPDNRKIYTKIKVYYDDMMEAQLNSRAAVEIIAYDGDDVYGQVVAMLGEADSLKSYTEGIIIEHDIKQEFDEETIAEAENIPDTVTDISGRTDYRDKLIFTIDGDTARDFDDAVSLEILENGNYYLGVHIADVTHYVKEGTSLDKEAYERATSVYLADRVIPMLPQKLSNGICSLNPNVDRLTLSVMMEIDKTGNVLSHKIEKAVINSKERMTYNNVTALLEGTDEALLERYEYMLPTLKKMKELSDILENMRDKRGAIDFDFPETSVLVDEDGTPVEIIGDERGISNKIIEEFMLTANETVAEYAYWSELPFVYRVHEPPAEDRITEFNRFIANFGLSIKGKTDEPIHPKALQMILDAVEGTPEERMVATKMLRSLMKAEYKPENMGHFGLSAKYYCHFTSPIRRYPDLTIHRILKEFIDGKLDDNRIAHYNRFVSEASKHSSDAEIEAEHTENDVDDLMKTAYMSSFVGAEFKGVVSSVTSFGMFVELENSVEGLIRVENMKADYFNFDEQTSSLIGERTGITYKIGDEANVILMKADIMLRQLDFVLSDDASNDMFRQFEKREARIQRQNNSLRRFVNKKKRRRNKRRHG